MNTNRMEAFSDGVIAVIITIMVLELKPPLESTLPAILAVLPSFVVYGLSFLVVAIMWVNHHHLLHAAKRAETALLWANNNLLFWMSLIPFVTGYLGAHYREPLAVACYGAVLTMNSVGFLLLQWVLASQNGDSERQIVHFCRIQLKSTLGLLIYASSIPLAFVRIEIAFAVLALVPAAYFWPEKRVVAEVK
jgi:uncharacterized membrane protein